MSNQGQIGTATSSILVQDGIYDEFVAKFKTAVATISKIGDQWDETTYQGPQVSKAQYDRIYCSQCSHPILEPTSQCRCVDHRFYDRDHSIELLPSQVLW